MGYLKLLLCFAAIAMFTFTVIAFAEDDNALSGVGGYLDTGDNSAKKEIREAFGEEDLFNPGKSTSTLGTGKKAAVAVTRDMLPSASKTSEVAYSPASVAGKWSLVLTDSIERSVNLMLAQADDAIFGRGYMVYGDVTQEVAAIGSVSGNEISLDLLSLNDLNLYRLDMDLNGNLLSGEYAAYSASADAWSGVAEGSIS